MTQGTGSIADKRAIKATFAANVPGTARANLGQRISCRAVPGTLRPLFPWVAQRLADDLGDASQNADQPTGHGEDFYEQVAFVQKGQTVGQPQQTNAGDQQCIYLVGSGTTIEKDKAQVVLLAEEFGQAASMDCLQPSRTRRNSSVRRDK